MLEKFQELKESFYSKNPDLTFWDGQYANYLKVALDGLRVNYVKKGPMRTVFTWPTLFISLFHLIQRVRLKINSRFYQNYRAHIRKANSFTHPDIMLFDLARYQLDEEQKPASVHFHHIYLYLSAVKRVFFTGEKEIKNYRLYHDSYEDRKYIRTCLPLNKELKRIYQDAAKVYQKNAKRPCYTKEERLNFNRAFQNFLDDLCYWYYIFQELKPKQIWFMCHYHKEGFMLAAKLHKIALIELQHGLIAESDIFYQFPKSFESVRSRALMPDKILTYGQYWSNILQKGHVLPLNQTSVLGYYQYERKTPLTSEIQKVQQFAQGRKIILVTTQTSMHDFFIKYIDSCIAHEDWKKSKLCFVVKTHPAEKQETYQLLERYAEVMMVSDIPLGVLFHLTQVHVTIYSTTIFDALRSGVSTYCVEEPLFEDYLSEIEKAVPVQRVKHGEVPGTLGIDESLDVSFYYQEPNFQILLDIANTRFS